MADDRAIPIDSLSGDDNVVHDASAVLAEVDVTGATILIIDDEPTVSDIVEIYLQDYGYDRIHSTTESTRALEIIGEIGPDALLLDLNMPGMNGLEILAALRSRAALEHLPVIVLTSATDTETKLESLRRGATDFLSKPVDPSELTLRLRNVLINKAYYERLAYTDSVSGCANRLRFMQEIRRAVDSGHRFIVAEIGLDRFQRINDALGYSAGDRVLQAIGQRLRAFCDATRRVIDPVQSFVGRTGGDEFMVLLDGRAYERDLGGLSEDLFGAIAAPCWIDGTELYPAASIGIARYPRHGAEAETVVAKASTALAYAKRQSGLRVQVFDDDINNWSQDRLQLETELRHALEREELHAFYQPKVDFRTGQVVGAEVLLRWLHSERGFVSPDQFIAIAEANGLIFDFGEWVLRESCQQAQRWIEAGLTDFRIAVNVASCQFEDPGLFQQLRDTLEKTGLAPELLTLELTESMVMGDPDETIRMLESLKRSGIRISVDDFGTGYSSLSYLRRLPIDELKIDRSFVSDVPRDRKGSAIVEGIVGMARGLGLKVVAEGIETVEQRDFMAGLQVDEYQGFLFSRPVPAQAFFELARASRAAPPGPLLAFGGD